MTISAPAERASAIASAWVLYALASMTAPMKFSKSAGSPIRIVLTSSTSFSFTSGHRFDGTYSREAAEHFWPWYSKEPRTTAVATASASADGCARMKSFPPVSPTRRG